MITADTTKRNSIFTNKELEHLYTFKDFPVYMGCTTSPQDQDLCADMSFGICKDTGTIQLENLVDPTLVYLEHHNDGIGKAWSTLNKSIEDTLKKYNSTNILELGGGEGHLANYYTQHNQGASWTIVDRNHVKESTKAIKRVTAVFEDMPICTQPLDTIVHSNFLEHTINPLNTLKQIYKQLPEDGYHIFAIPDMENQLITGTTNCLNFEHTLLLTRSNVIHMLNLCGFTIIERCSNNPLSDIYVTKKSKRPMHIRNLNDYEYNKTLFTNYIHLNTERVTNINKQMLELDCPIYFFGAHIFYTILRSFGLNESKIAGIVDNSELKNNKRLYGTKFLSQYPNDILWNKTAVILNVAQYRNEIVEQLKLINNELVILDGNNIK